MEQQFVATHRHTVLQETEKTSLILSRPTRKHVVLFTKYKKKQFSCVHNILTEAVFVTQLSSNAWIPFLRIVWFSTTCRFMIDGLV
jgi:hypothetical protein